MRRCISPSGDAGSAGAGYLKCVADRLLDVQSFQDLILPETQSPHGSLLPLTPAPACPSCSLKAIFLFANRSFNLGCPLLPGLARKDLHAR